MMNGAKNIVAISLNGNVGRNYLKQKQNDVMSTCSKMEIVERIVSNFDTENVKYSFRLLTAVAE